MRTFRLILGLVVVAIVFGAGVGAAGLLNLPNPFKTETIDRSQPALLKSIQDISEYHAAVGNFEVVVDVEHDVKFVPSFLSGDRSLFVAAGTIDAYVDFSGLGKGDLRLSEDGKFVEIKLPAAALGKPNLDQQRTYLFSQDRGLLDRVDDALSTQDQSELYQSAEDKLSAAAEESELTQQADENTRKMLTGLCKSLGITAVFVDEPSD